MSLAKRTLKDARARGMLAPDEQLTGTWPGALTLIQRGYRPVHEVFSPATLSISSEQLLILSQVAAHTVAVDLLYIRRALVGQLAWRVQLSLIGEEGWTMIRWDRSRRQPAMEVIAALEGAASARLQMIMNADRARVAAILARGAELDHEADVLFGRASADDPGPDPTKRFGVSPGEIAAWQDRPGAHDHPRSDY